MMLVLLNVQRHLVHPSTVTLNKAAAQPHLPPQRTSPQPPLPQQIQLSPLKSIAKLTTLPLLPQLPLLLQRISLEWPSLLHCQLILPPHLSITLSRPSLPSMALPTSPLTGHPTHACSMVLTPLLSL